MTVRQRADRLSGAGPPTRGSSSPPLAALVGSVRASTAPAGAVKTPRLRESAWACKRVVEAGTVARAPQGAGHAERPRSSQAPLFHNDRPSVQQLVQWIQQELDFQGLEGLTPSIERVRVFSTAFSEVIEMLPSYRPILLSVQKEYDGLVSRLQAQINASGSMEGRFKTLKAESFSLVGESMTWFKLEIASLQQRLLEAEKERDSLRSERARLTEDYTRLQEASEKDRSRVVELHGQNLDVLRHLERMETQVERLRATEKDVQLVNGRLKQEGREKDLRIETVEAQLTSERQRVEAMVPREEFEQLRADMSNAEIAIKELEEISQAKQKDYLSLVESYARNMGQKIGDGYAVRPLTPRPTWYPCRGLLDVDAPHSTEKADTAQELLQHILASSRTAMSGYGLATAAQKSSALRRFARHDVFAAFVAAEGTQLRSRAKDAADDGAKSSDTSALDTRATVKEDAWLPPDVDPNTPEPFRHDSKVKNLQLSRKRVAEYIEGLILLRSRNGVQSLSRPFLGFMLDHPPEGMHIEDARDFVINVYVAVQRFAAEPDFLAYLLLIKGKISDVVVRDNKALCGELHKLFTNHFEAGDGSKTITKQKFFQGLREVLGNKEKDMWQDLVTYSPVGGPDVVVNYEWLLFDDMYVLAPLVYALRLQHLDETVNLSDRLERGIRSSLKESQRVVRYDALEAAFKDDQELHAWLQEEDYAKTFGVPVRNLQASTEQDVDKVVELMKHGEIFHVLYFPALPNDDGDSGPLNESR